MEKKQMEMNEILQQCKDDPTLKISDQELEKWIEEIKVINRQ